MPDRSWFTAKAENDNSAEIAIYDEIGAFGVRADAFRDALKALGNVKAIALRINSPGGDVFDSLAIHNMLARHKATITVTIDGIAASMASVIAMAGDEVLMPDNAMMMIHDPSGLVFGTSKEMRDLAEALDKIKSGMMSAYTRKTKIPRDELADMMAAETWMTAAEAVDMGFADSILDPVKVAARFDLSKYPNAPAMAGRKPRGSAALKPGLRGEDKMTDAEKAAAKAVADEAEKKAKDEAALKAAAEAAAKLAAQSGAETPAQMTARITAEITERHKQIASACTIANLPNKAPEFIASGKSLGEVLSELQTLRGANGGKDISSRHGNDQPDAASWDKVIGRLPGGKKAA
jgi:ATP-dependent protease ClpP protease subunit